MGQTRTHSLAESGVNVLIGYGVALLSQLVIFPQYGVVLSLVDNLKIGGWFTLVSLARSYVLRRAFNRYTVRGNGG